MHQPIEPSLFEQRLLESKAQPTTETTTPTTETTMPTTETTDTPTEFDHASGEWKYETPPELRSLLPKQPPNMARLTDILTLRRGHDSVGEAKVIDQIISKYNPIALRDPTDKSVSAFVVYVGDAKVLWSCHIDTVHRQTDDVKQLILHDEGTSMIYKQDGSPLGADDGAGMWLLLEMIDAGVGGTYIFHRGEERGGIGSRAIAKNHADFLGLYTHAIAFDRRDTCSIITKQSRGRCCSDDFAKHFAAMLSDDYYGLKPDPTGTFTDTANYISHIGECTNVSIGYYNEHGGSEILDVSYLLWLRDKMINIDVDKLTSVKVRKAGEIEPCTSPSWPGYGRSWQRDALGFDDDEQWWGGVSNPPKDKFSTPTTPAPVTTKKKRGKVTPIAGHTSSPSTFTGNGPFRGKIRTADDVLNLKAYDLKNWISAASTWEVTELVISLALQIVFPSSKK